jgi:sugar porter (SP) family MFS transporter
MFNVIKGSIYRSAFIASLGGLLFGFDTAVISGAEATLNDIYLPVYKSLANNFGSLSFWHGFTVASALIGTIIGSIAFGRPADRYGRRSMLFLIGALYMISALGSALAFDWWFFVVMRLIGGLAVGGSSVVSPMYNAEISPASLRGRLVALTQLNVVLGIMLAYLSNYLINELNLGDMAWRWMFGVEVVPAFLFFVLMFLNPRSPRWLVSRGLVKEAKTIIEQLGSDTGDVSKEVKEIQNSLQAENTAKSELFFQKRHFPPISLAVLIAMFNQLSGINAILYYAPRVFEMAGFEKSGAMLSSFGIGFVMLIFTLIALVIIDHFGRKNLMIWGSIGYILSLAAVAATFYSNGTNFTYTGSIVVLISIMIFIAAHGFGQGAVIWVFISEIFPNKVRARGQSLGSFTHWFMAAIVSWTFPVFAEFSGGHVFTFYMICMILQLLWVVIKMPETKGVSLEQLEKKWH